MMTPQLAFWISLLVTSGSCDTLLKNTNSPLAVQTQQSNLQALFLKYGENGTISLTGLVRLLKSLGLDRIRNVTVQHHQNKHSSAHMHIHSHLESNNTTHTESVNSKNGANCSGVEKNDPICNKHFESNSMKKSQLHAHHNSHVNHRNYHDEHHHGQMGLNNSHKCQNATTILQTHGMSPEEILSVHDFSILCPSLLMQIDSKACLLHSENQSEHDFKNYCPHNHSQGSTFNSQHIASIPIAWIGGFLSVTIISVLALVGGILIPLINKVCFNFLLSFLVALAVGTLSGDALLHLIPHSQRHHKQHHRIHESSEHFYDDDADDDLMKPVWMGLTALGGVYIMFLIEHVLTLAKMYKDKKKKEQKKLDLAVENSESQHLSAPVDLDVKTADGINGNKTWGQGLPEEEEMLSQGNYTDEDCEDKCHSHFHDTVGQSDGQHHHHHNYHHILHHHHSQNHHPHTHKHRHTHSYSVQHFRHAGVATLAWMVLMGDGLHNFSDGLAIGAAFTKGLSSGLSTSLAVFCHELPHELGDFAVLLKSGMTVKQAILYNLLSALMGYLGMIIGILIGQYAENVAMWIFALTAGLFLYVALVDMVPEMLHNDASEAGFSHYGFFVLQNIGMLLGFGIMLVIALFGHKIHLGINF